MLLECRSTAVAAVVLTVKLAVVVTGPTVQIGPSLTTGVTLHAIMTVPVNPPVGLMVITDVPEPPGDTV
jgi:hypothetical protein